MSADMSMMYLIHNAIRRDLDYLAAQVAGCDAGDPARVAELRQAFDFVALQLEHHHHGEDEDLWPLVRSRLGSDPGQLAVLEAMQEQHAAIDPALAAVRESFTALASGRGRPADTATALRTLREGVGDHLANEERDAVPILERTLTDEDLTRFSNQQRRRAGGMKAGAAFLPWLFDGMTDEQRRSAMTPFPPPLRFLTNRVFVRTYRKAAPALAGRELRSPGAA